MKNVNDVTGWLSHTTDISKYFVWSPGLRDKESRLYIVSAGHGSSMGCASALYVDGCGFDPHMRQNILLLRFGHEKISTTILSLQLIQEGQLSVTGQRMGSKYW